MPGRGKIVIVAMFTVALAMGGYAWWAQYQKGRQTLEFWGARSTNLIRHAQRVEVLLLSDPPPDAPVSEAPVSEAPGDVSPVRESRDEELPDDEAPISEIQDAQTSGAEVPAAEYLTVAGQRRMVTQRRDISQVRGLVHARHTLVVDSSYLWDEPRGDCQANWRFALRFQDQNESVTLVFDQTCARVRLLEQDREIGILRPLSELLEQRHLTWAAEGHDP